MHPMFVSRLPATATSYYPESSFVYPHSPYTLQAEGTRFITATWTYARYKFGPITLGSILSEIRTRDER